MEQPSKPEKITISAFIKAEKNKVWDYYTKPEHIINWNFASDDWYCPTAENDLKQGGKYKARMEAKDGSFGFDYEATYDQVIIENKLISKMPDGREVINTFEKHDDGTLVTTVFDAEFKNPIEMQRNGWQAILNSFKTYTETH
ncbi:SRPBCC domain-containing protein [Aegicerativicinus sediminis]|uniref:SRPBCC domain-containing protein n=1 Tax=Aegicerativicinus sediminis TaxID=2893202 RepID=UPI001E602F1B|nr:SRPBCC domain-containing protein [Aegicerativicinus sediminis]